MIEIILLGIFICYNIWEYVKIKSFGEEMKDIIWMLDNIQNNIHINNVSR